jgi:hypothetical protein
VLICNPVDSAGGQQHIDQYIVELQQEAQQEAASIGGCEQIRAVLVESARRFGKTQSLCG